MPLITPSSATLSLPVVTQFAAVTESGGQVDRKNEPEYAILKRRIQDAGLLKKRPAYYALSITTNSVLLILCLVALFSVGSVWAQALAAAGLGIVSGQLGFQLHDSGHRQMFVSGWQNAPVGLVTADLLLALTSRWLVPKHNPPPRNPNDIPPT